MTSLEILETFCRRNNLECKLSLEKAPPPDITLEEVQDENNKWRSRATDLHWCCRISGVTEVGCISDTAEKAISGAIHEWTEMRDQSQEKP